MLARKNLFNKKHEFIDTFLEERIFRKVMICEKSKVNLINNFNLKVNQLLEPTIKAELVYQNDLSIFELNETWILIEKSLIQSAERFIDFYNRVDAINLVPENISMASMETHNLGEQVIFFELDGVKFVYKPVNGYAHKKIYDISLEVCSNLGINNNFIQKPFVTQKNYSIYYFVEDALDVIKIDNEEYSFISGSLVALSFYFNLIDMHKDNVISSPFGPVLIDLECSFYQCPFVNYLDIFDSGLISLMNSGLDTRLIGNNKRSFLHGFSKCYDFLDSQKKIIISDIRAMPISTISRYVVRPTRYYMGILRKILFVYGENKYKKQLLLTTLINDASKFGIQDSDAIKISEKEINDMFNADIPYFYGKLSSRTLFCREENIIDDFFEFTIIDSICHSIQKLSDTDKEQNIKMFEAYFDNK